MMLCSVNRWFMYLNMNIVKIRFMYIVKKRFKYLNLYIVKIRFM